MESQEYPVAVGEIHNDIECRSSGAKGDGMFKIKGLAIFVPNAEVGKRYNIKITNVKPKVAFGEIV
jgi:predicted RNA-binding protein with TRAM domain